MENDCFNPFNDINPLLSDGNSCPSQDVDDADNALYDQNTWCLINGILSQNQNIIILLIILYWWSNQYYSSYIMNMNSNLLCNVTCILDKLVNCCCSGKR